MPPKRKRPVGRPRKNPKQRKSVPQKEIKELTPKRQSWAKLFHLPFEVLELIFRYAAPLDYWTYRIFREFERFRLCLDPVYFVQTNIQPNNKLSLLDSTDPNSNPSTELFKIPPDQNQGIYTFSSYNDFVRNIKTHAKKFKYARYRHIFIEVEVKDFDFGHSLYRILKYLQSERIECSLFMRYVKVQTTSIMRNFLSNQFEDDIKMERLLYGDSQLILDEDFTKIIRSRFDSLSSIKRYKLLNYPSALEIGVDIHFPSCLSRLFLNQKNVVYKKSVQNLQHLRFNKCFDLFKKADKCLFTNLQTLNLTLCVNTRGHTFHFDKLSFPNLKRVAIENCGLIKISGCYFPNLTELLIDEEVPLIECVAKIPPKINIVNNELSSLRKLEIRTKRIGQIFGNTLNEDMELFNLSAMISDEGSFGDIPDIISSCESFVFNAENVMKDTINSLFSGLCDLSKLKKLKIDNTGSKGINYLENKMFSSLESFEFMGSSITNIPKLKMPSLKVFLIINSNMETVNIQGMDKLIKIIFNTSKRPDSEYGIVYSDRDPRYLAGHAEYMFTINLRKIPDSSRTSTIDLRFHEAIERLEPIYPRPDDDISFISTAF